MLVRDKWLRYERRLSPVGANASTDLEIMRSLIYSLLEDAKPAAIGVRRLYRRLILKLYRRCWVMMRLCGRVWRSLDTEFVNE
jgi:hypothetical protein